MSLNTCLTGLDFNSEDAREIRKIARMTGGDMRGVDLYIEGLDTDLLELREQLLDEGFDVDIQPAQIPERNASPQEEAARIRLRINQMAFENDALSGVVDLTDPLVDIDEVNAIRADKGLDPLADPTILFQQGPLRGFQPVGAVIPPNIPDPSPEVLAEAMADTARAGSAVNARLPIIIPESARVASSPYVVGHPDGRSWTELTEAELSVKGDGVSVTQAELDGIMDSVLPEVSAAAQEAVKITGASFQLTPEQLDRALKLDLRAQLWYELSGEMFKDGLPSLSFDQHFMFLDLIGATSARARPFDNLARSLAVLSQHVRGVPIDTDLAMPTAVSKALGRGGQDVTNLSGNKTGQFSNTMALTGGMETSYPIPVNDVWVGVMFGITDEQLTSNQSLHEVMALYQIKLAEMVREKGNAGTTVPHQPWHIQARGWVQLRSEDAGIDTTKADKVEGNDYAGEWPRMVKILKDAGVPGINEAGVMSQEALQSPLFIDALRPTVKGFRDAPKATIEVGTVLTTKGRYAADLVEAGLAVGDTLTESKYYDAILSALYKMSRKSFKKGSMLPLMRSIADNTFDVSRIQTGTKDKPFDVAGWFDGALSPNIRVPLQALGTDKILTDPETGEPRWSQISVFNAVAGKALNQAAMAASEVLPVNAADQPRDGYTPGMSVFVQDNEGVTPKQLNDFASALPEGYGLSSYSLPGGVVIDINPRYDPETDSLIGLQDTEELSAAIKALGVADGVASTLDHDFRSVYDEASEYDIIIEQFTKHVKAEAVKKLLAVEKTVIRKVKDNVTKQFTEVEEVIRLTRAQASSIADATSPVSSVAKRKIPSSIRGRISTVAKALEGRLSSFATGQQGYTDLAQELEAKLEKDFGPAAKRIAKAGGTAPPLAPSNKGDTLLQEDTQDPQGTQDPKGVSAGDVNGDVLFQGKPAITPELREEFGEAQLEYNHDLYFDVGPDAIIVPLSQINPIRARPEGIANAKVFMGLSARGENSKRIPLSLKDNGDGTFDVRDGNSTFATAQQSGWPDIPGRVLSDEQFAQEKEAKAQKKRDAKAAEQIDTPQFKEWFGDSDVVNEDGTPKVMFHGTSNYFDTFRDGPEIFLSEERGFAHGFARMKRGGPSGDQSPRVAEFFVSAKVFDFRKPDHLKLLTDWIEANTEDGVVFDPIGGGEVGNIDVILEAAEDGEFGVLESPGVREEVIQENGFTGFNLVETAGGAINLAVFHSEQLKSATDNDGTFDPNDPNTLLQNPTEAAVQIKDDGDIGAIQTGTPISFNFIHNTESATAIFGIPEADAQFGRGLEPSGRYMIISSAENATRAAADNPNLETGNITLSRPLVVPNNGLAWKQELSDKYGGLTGKELSKAIIADGFDAVVTMDGDHTSEIVEFQSFDEAKALFQSPSDPKGGFTPGLEGITINLFEGQDLSTLLHESGHMFVFMLEKMSQLNGASQRLKDNYAAMLDWVGAESAEDLNLQLNGEDARAKQEKLAEAFEAYLKEGKAPSVKLSNAFSQFAQWLKIIYTKFRTLGTQIDPEISAVFDRMLATDAQIEEMRAIHEFDPASAKGVTAMMTPEERTKWSSLSDAADDVAKAEAKRIFIEAEMRAQQEVWKNEHKKSVETVTDEVWARPENRALWFLTHGGFRETDTPADQLNLRLSKQALLDRGWTEEQLKSIPKGPRNAFTDIKDQAMDPDVLAGMLNFESSDHLMTALVGMEAPAVTIEREATTMTDAILPNPVIDGTMEELSEQKLYNEERRQAIQIELDVLADAASKPKVTKAAISLIVDRMLETESVQSLMTPTKYMNAAVRSAVAAGKAIAKGDSQAAFEHKRRQMLNHELLRRSLAVKKTIEKENAYMRKFDRRGKHKGIHQDYLEKIRLVTSTYNLGTRMSNQRRERLEAQAFHDWMQNMRVRDGAVFMVPQEVLDADEKTHWRDITWPKYQALVSTVKNLDAQGRIVVRGERADESRDINTLIALMEVRMKDLPNSTLQARKAARKDWNFFIDGLGGKIARADAAMLKASFLLEFMDGGPTGPAQDGIFEPMVEAEFQENTLTKELFDAFSAAYENIPKKIRADMNTRYLNANLGDRYSRNELLHIALNMGNSSNMGKMVEGSQKDRFAASLTEDGIREALKDLTAEEIAFVNQVWQSFESMKERVGEVSLKETREPPKWLDPIPMELPNGTLTGGYIPMMYDPSKSQAGERIENQSALDAMKSQEFQASVFSGMSKDRSPGFSQPLIFDITRIPQEMRRSAHFITHYDAIRHAMKLVNDQRFQNLVEDKFGADYYDMLKAWVGQIAVGHRESSGKFALLDDLSDWARGNATVAIMGASATTILTQPLGLFTSVDNLARGVDGKVMPGRGAFRMIQGVTQMITSPSTVKAAFETSKELRFRKENSDREVRNSLKGLEGAKGKKAATQRFLLQWIPAMQFYAVDIPTYIAAYNVGVKGGLDPEATRAFADRAMGKSQGGGSPKDMAVLLATRGASGALTMFMTFFSTLFGIQRRLGREKAWTPDFAYKLVAGFITVYVVPQMIEALFRLEGPDPDDDDDEFSYAKFIAQKVAMFAAGSVPVGRSLASGIGSPWGFSPTPLIRAGDDAIKTINIGAKMLQGDEDVDGVEFTSAMVRTVISALGFATGRIPSTQINRAVKSWELLEEEGPDDFNHWQFVVGPDKKGN